MEKQYHLPVLDEKRTYTNPLSYGEGVEIPTNPDPYIIRYGGKYYCYSSDSAGVNVSVSDDMTKWTYLGSAVNETEKHDYWAPCVFYDNGTFYMYCSNTPIDTDDCHHEYLQLYTAEYPEGPFLYQKTFFDKFSIDAHVVKDTDGELYLFYSVNDYMGTDAEHSGTVILVDRLLHYTELAGEEKPVVLPSIEEEIFEKNRFGDGRDWHTIEGAFFFRHRRKAYLMYAANAYVRENYFLGYSRADSSKRIADMKWKKYPDNNTFSPLVRRNEKVEGTGHNSVIKAPNLVDDWIVYHGRNQEQPLIEGVEQRTMRMDPILYCGDKMLTNAPSYLEQDAPAEALFATKNGMKDKNFSEKHVNEGIHNILNIPLENYVLEADVKAEPTHMGAVYGILLYYKNESNFAELLLNSGKRNISIVLTENNVTRTICTTPVSINYNHKVLHHLRIERIVNLFKVFLDDRFIFSQELNVPYGKIGTTTKYTNTDWIYFAVSEHAEFYGETLTLLPAILKADSKMYLSNGEPDDIERLCGSSKTEVILNEEISSFPSLKSIEFHLDTEDSYVCIELIDSEQNELASVEINTKNYHVFSRLDGSKKILTEASNTERFLTVYLKQNNHKCAIWANGIYTKIEDLNVSGCNIRIHLFKAGLTGYDYTKLCK